MKTGRDMLILLLLFFFSINPARANLSDIRDANEAQLMKARDKASRVKDGDWKSLAECAKMLLDKNIRSTEVLEWLEKSISIRETSFNVTLLGEYYNQNQLFDEAHVAYIRAIQLAQDENNKDQIPSIQMKMLISMGTRNYYNSLKEANPR